MNGGFDIVDMHTLEAVRDPNREGHMTRHVIATAERRIAIEGEFARVGNQLIPLSNVREFTVKASKRPAFTPITWESEAAALAEEKHAKKGKRQ